MILKNIRKFYKQQVLQNMDIKDCLIQHSPGNLYWKSRNNRVIRDGVYIVCEELGINEQGERAIFLTKKSPLRDSSNKIIGLMGASIDITTQKQSETLKSRFIHDMQHDIRTPCTSIYGMLELLIEQETDAEKKIF